MLTIYGVYRSRASRPLWLLDEIGMDFAHQPVIQAYRLPNADAPDAPLNTRSPQFLAVNPMALIPSMDDDGFVLHESLAITLYLAKKYGGMLGPQDLQEEAMMVQWALFAATGIETPALDMQKLLGSDQANTAEGTEKAEALARSLERPFDVLETHLKGNPHMVGNRFTAADIIVAEIVRYAQGYAQLFEARPALKTWIDSCQSRPAFKAMWEKRLQEPA